MRLILILVISTLVALAACQKTLENTSVNQPPQNNVQPPPISAQPQTNLPPIIAKDTLINDCPQFSDLRVEYSQEFRSYISVLSPYQALFKTSKDVQGYKIRGGVGSKGDIIVYCSKGIGSLSQDENLIYCSGDNTNTPLFAESFITNTDGSTTKVQKKITLTFALDGAFYQTYCK